MGWTPTVGEFFASYYHENHYFAPVDLSPEALGREVTATAQMPMDCFQYRRVHFQVDGRYVFKNCAPRGGKDAIYLGPGRDDGNEASWGTPDDDLLRVFMSRMAQQAIDRNGWQDRVVVPKKEIWRNGAFDGLPKTTITSGQVFVAVPKVQLEGGDHHIEATLRWIAGKSSDEQRKLATFVATVLREIPLADAKLENLAKVAGTEQLSLHNTRPHGAMVSLQSGLKPASKEKCARIGICNLLEDVQKYNADGINDFLAQLRVEYAKVATPKLAKWKIVASIVMPLIPLVLLIISIVKSFQAGSLYSKSRDAHQSGHAEPKIRKELTDQLIQSVEGVPGFLKPGLSLRFSFVLRSWLLPSDHL